MTWQNWTRQWILGHDYIDLKALGEIVANDDDNLVHAIAERMGQSSLAVYTLDIVQAYKLGKISN